MKTVSELGGPTAVAKIVNLSAPTVHGWKAVPMWHCPAIERHFKGEVTVEEMRPDVSWLRVKDENWPHPEGRPLADFAATEAAAQSIEVKAPQGEVTHG